VVRYVHATRGAYRRVGVSALSSKGVFMPAESPETPEPPAEIPEVRQGKERAERAVNRIRLFAACVETVGLARDLITELMRL
jgi:hypothetical protein